MPPPKKKNATGCRPSQNRLRSLLQLFLIENMQFPSESA